MSLHDSQMSFLHGDVKGTIAKLSSPVLQLFRGIALHCQQLLRAGGACEMTNELGGVAADCSLDQAKAPDNEIRHLDLQERLVSLWELNVSPEIRWRCKGLPLEAQRRVSE